jgi:enamine deaminase RidA (YjgF/YER057c/UK114 family)
LSSAPRSVTSPSCPPGRRPSTSAVRTAWAPTAKIVSDDVAEQSARAIDNASTALEAAGASLADVVQWTVFMAEGADLNAAYEAIGPRLAGPGAPPLVTMARVAALGVPGALVEVSAIAAVVPG